jgi:hypothetical protein
VTQHSGNAFAYFRISSEEQLSPQPTSPRKPRNAQKSVSTLGLNCSRSSPMKENRSTSRQRVNGHSFRQCWAT